MFIHIIHGLSGILSPIFCVENWIYCLGQWYGEWVMLPFSLPLMYSLNKFEYAYLVYFRCSLRDRHLPGLSCKQLSIFSVVILKQKIPTLYIHVHLFFYVHQWLLLSILQSFNHSCTDIFFNILENIKKVVSTMYLQMFMSHR